MLRFLSKADDGVSARKLFRQSMVDPNDNVVAQAVWASHRLRDLNPEEMKLDTPRSFEARARSFYTAEQWQASLAECEEWLFDEPFSSRPAILGSFIAEYILGDYVTAERLVKQALDANPSHWGLRNNLALAQANLGNVSGAQATIDAIPHSQLTSELAVVVRATQGLIRFRRGEIAAGRADYQWAVEQATTLMPGRGVAIALAHLAQEEVRAKTDEATVAVDVAMIALSKIRAPDVAVGVERARQMLNDGPLPDAPPKAALVGLEEHSGVARRALAQLVGNVRLVAGRLFGGKR